MSDPLFEAVSGKEDAPTEADVGELLLGDELVAEVAADAEEPRGLRHREQHGLLGAGPGPTQVLIDSGSNGVVHRPSSYCVAHRPSNCPGVKRCPDRHENAPLWGLSASVTGDLAARLYGSLEGSYEADADYSEP